MPAKSKKQLKFMQAVANNPKFAKKVGVPTKVGKEFVGKKKGGEIKGKELQRLLEKERRNEPGLEGFYPEEYIVVPGKVLKAGSVLLDAGLEKAQASGLFKRGGKVKKYEDGGKVRKAIEDTRKFVGETEESLPPPKGFKSDKKPVPKDNPGLKKLPTEVRNKMGYMKKGGKIGMGMTKNNYKKGGKVSSCSNRADGCAIKGKTKGRMV